MQYNLHLERNLWSVLRTFGNVIGISKGTDIEQINNVTTSGAQIRIFSCEASSEI